jgi:hypothetical protein
LLSIRAEYFVFQFAIQTFKDYDIQNYSFACFLDGCETWSLSLREDCRLRVFENWVLRGIFGAKNDKVKGSGANLIMRSLMICTAHPLLCR